MAAALTFIVANDDGSVRDNLGREWRGRVSSLLKDTDRCVRAVFLEHKWTLSSFN